MVWIIVYVVESMCRRERWYAGPAGSGIWKMLRKRNRKMNANLWHFTI